MAKAYTFPSGEATKYRFLLLIPDFAWMSCYDYSAVLELKLGVLKNSDGQLGTVKGVERTDANCCVCTADHRAVFILTVNHKSNAEDKTTILSLGSSRFSFSYIINKHQ